jgi:WD40 repeat protein
LHRVTFSPDGTRFATAGCGTAKIWDAASGEELLTVSNSPGRSALDVAFSPDGKKLATAGSDTTVWEVATGKELLILQHSTFVARLSFSPDGTRLITGNSEKTVQIWDVTRAYLPE